MPIIGDRLYNPRNLIAKGTPNEVINLIQNFPRQALHASKLKFQDMVTGKDLEFETSLPEDMQILIDGLR